MIIDDEKDLRAIVSDVLKDEGYFTTEAKDGLCAIKSFKSEAPDVVLLDLNMPNMKGIEAMHELIRMDPSVPVIILTGYGDVQTAVEAIKAGAYDFTVKPPDFERLLLTIARAVEKRTLEREWRKASFALESSLENVLGRSEAMKKVITQIKQVAHTDFSVIIQGETGCGKSVVAETIHNISCRSARPLVSVDIGLLPDLLVESELFGYRKGAFTGADRDKAGYFESANGGTIFIDELENISPHVQAKLLSFIEKKVIYPLGATSPVKSEVRIIAATNKEIRECVEKREFREDLFYRIGEFFITVPPLRERTDDIPFFAKKFLFGAASELNRQIRGIEEDAVSLLTRYSWPGNLRELKNLMRRSALINETDCIGPDCIDKLLGEGAFCKKSTGLQPMKEAMRELEKRMISEALDKTGGNKTRAAELLDISYKNLFDKVKEYKIR